MDNIGLIGNNVSQEVDFFSGDNSYFPTLNPAIVGFSQMFTSGNGSLLITNQDISSLDNLLQYRTFNFSDDINSSDPTPLYENYYYDPRTPRIGVPTTTDWGSYAGSSHKNIYLGSALDDLDQNNLTPDTPYLSSDETAIYSGNGTSPFAADTEDWN